mmetsp:Transcript_30319/g.41563  ORF Transcript_30319/g.41563 Transcript_30319/m.41563 type:complete len:104 (+) Transcript_30319:259-570(+)
MLEQYFLVWPYKKQGGRSNDRVSGRITTPTIESVRSRPAYVDVANSQHARCLTAGFAFGGTYEFVVVRKDAPKHRHARQAERRRAATTMASDAAGPCGRWRTS